MKSKDSLAGQPRDPVCVVGDWRVLDLRFTQGTGQSRMSRWFPTRLVVDYTRTMLGALWLAPHASHIGHVGLGGGSQVKFLHQHLPAAQQVVAEIHPDVIALRRAFKIPDDDARLQVHQVDAATWLPTHKAALDVLLVDGYDATGIPAALSTPAFYAACCAALKPGGAAAFNLYDTDHAAHLQRLESAFGPNNVRVLEEAQQSNRVAFAWRDPVTPGVPLRLSWRGRWALRGVFVRMASWSLGERHE